MIFIPHSYPNKFYNGINHPDLYLWDAWSYYDEREIHLYCLALSRLKNDGTALEPHERNDYPFHVRHFTSADNGLSWQDQGCFLKPDQVPNFDIKTIWSGSVKPMPNGDKLVGFTGLEKGDDKLRYRQYIAFAISKDGYTVHHFNDTILSSPSTDWQKIIDKGYYLDELNRIGHMDGEENGPIMAWRDPFVFYDKNEELNMFWAAKTAPRVGVMARVTVADINDVEHTTTLHPPISVPDQDQFTQLEVPKILFDDVSNTYYLMISTCNRIYENQPDSEINKEVRLYKSSSLNGPWQSLGDKILDTEHLFGATVLKSDFKNNRLLCMAPYTEKAEQSKQLTFAPVFYIDLNTLKVEFLNTQETKI